MERALTAEAIGIARRWAPTHQAELRAAHLERHTLRLHVREREFERQLAATEALRAQLTRQEEEVRSLLASGPRAQSTHRRRIQDALDFQRAALDRAASTLEARRRDLHQARADLAAA